MSDSEKDNLTMSKGTTSSSTNEPTITAHSGYSTGQSTLTVDNIQQQQQQSISAVEAAAENDPTATSPRKGLQANVFWDGDDDPDCPLNLPYWRKCLIVFIICTAAVCVTSASSMVTNTYPQVQEEFNISSIVAALGLTLFVTGLGIGPMFLAPLSEFYGRNLIYRTSYFGFLCFIIPVACAQNVQTWLIGRFFGGVCGSAFLSVAGGTVADIFRPKDVPLPMAIYTACPFLGPAMGPVISGFVCQHTTWRWTWYALIIWACVEYACLFFLVPETYSPTLLKRKANRLRQENDDDSYLAPLDLDDRSVIKVIILSCARPFQILLLEPMALLLCTWTALLLGILYGFFSSYSLVFGPGGHNFDIQFVGLSFAGIGLGTICGTCTFPFWKHLNEKLAAKNPNETPGPEIHLRQAMFGGIVAPIGIIWFAFTSYPHIHWIVPIIGSVLFGTGSILVFIAVFTYLVAAYRPYAASAMAANSILRSSFAAAFPLFVVQSYKHLGNDWASAMYGFLALALAPLPFIFYKLGPKLRKESRFSGLAPSTQAQAQAQTPTQKA